MKLHRCAFLLLALALVTAGAASLSAQSYAGADQPMQAGFGSAVAVVGEMVLVGEPENPTGPGVVYVFRRDPQGQWTEVAQLTAPDAQPRDGFGAALAVHGPTLLVGGTGAAFTFRREGDAWRYSGRLDLPSDGEAAPTAASLALAEGVALVGVPMAGEQSGRAYVFRRDGNDWNRVAELTQEGLTPRTGFGAAVATNGSWALVGAPGYQDQAGAVFAYRRTAAGEWERAGNLAPEQLEQGTGFGAALSLRREFLAVGAPGYGGGMGAAYVIRYNDDNEEWRLLTRLLPFDGEQRDLFGSAVALGENTVWVGAPRAERFRGVVYAFRAGHGSMTWDGVDRLSSVGLKVRDLFGAVASASDEVAAVGLPGADYGAGTVIIFERGPGGDWKEAATVLSEVRGLAAVTGAMVPCGDAGRADVFDCQNVDLVSFLPVKDMGAGRGVRTNDVWGWTDPSTGREYALVGLLDQVSFVDVTDAENPVYVGKLPKPEHSPGSTWRDMKVYENHMFVVADAADEHGMQVFDLTRLRGYQGEPITYDADVIYDRIHSAHNIAINDETGFAYSVGNSSGGVTCGGGLHIIDIREPKQPRFAGCFADPQTGRSNTGYTHDAQCVVYHGPDANYRGREICFGSNETAFSIADVSDKDNPVALARAAYPNVGYSHQGWLSEDQRYFFMNDELDEIQRTVDRTRTLIWDVTELDDPQLAGEFFSPTSASDHNLYVVGDLIFQSHYQAGLRILDASDPTNLREIGFFDTVPYGTNTPGFGGSWSNYPYFQSGNVIVTSGYEGLFVLRPRVR